MADTYCVIDRDALSVPVAAAGRAIAKVTGKVAYDVTRELNKRVGILASGITQERADQIVGTLSQSSISAFSIPESDIVRFPEPVFLKVARLNGDALDISDLLNAAGNRIDAVRVPYKNIILVATGLVRTEIKKKVTETKTSSLASRGIGTAAMLGLGVPSLSAIIPRPSSGKQETRIVRKSHYDHCLDFFAVEPGHHLRLNASTFNFTQTGLDVQLSSLANLAHFIKNFAPRCEQAFVDPSIRHVLDGTPQTNLKFNTLGQYDAYLSWRIQLLYRPDA